MYGILPENDVISLKYISDKTGRFSDLDIKMFGKEATNKDIAVARNFLYEISDYDYDFEDGYVQIQLTQLVNIIIF